MKGTSLQEYIDQAASWSNRDREFAEIWAGKAFGRLTRDDLAFCVIRDLEWRLKNSEDGLKSSKRREDELSRRAELAEEKLLEARLVIRELEKRLVK